MDSAAILPGEERCVSKCHGSYDAFASILHYSYRPAAPMCFCLHVTVSVKVGRTEVKGE